MYYALTSLKRKEEMVSNISLHWNYETKRQFNKRNENKVVITLLKISKVITLLNYYNSNTVDVLWQKYVFGPSQISFSLKVNLNRSKNKFMPANIKSVVILFEVKRKQQWSRLRFAYIYRNSNFCFV